MKADSQEIDFTGIFKPISPEEIKDDVFTLAGKGFSVITAGGVEHYNSMTASGGVWVFILENPPHGAYFKQEDIHLNLFKRSKDTHCRISRRNIRSNLCFLEANQAETAIK